MKKAPVDAGAGAAMPVASVTRPSIFPLGESAIVCAFPAPATLAVQARVWAVAKAAAQWPHVSEVVPGMNNLTVLFEPLAADAEALAVQLANAFDTTLEATAAADTSGPAQRPVIEIPVIYGGADGPDLADVARHTGLTEAAVIARHAGAEYTVFFVGFQPGFAYLGGLDPALNTPRRAAPRLRVPAGSVGIGGAQTGIYPFASPGGWQLIGHSSCPLFDPAKAPPSLLQPGDRVRFVAVQPT